MKIVIPMAGKGSRFQALANKIPEYQKPKPLIDVKGRPMVVWAVDSLEKIQPQDLVFICLQEHETKYQIKTTLKKLFSHKIKVVLIPRATRGAVETVLAAKRYILPNDDLIVSDSDHFFDGTNLYQMINKKESDVIGIIPVFKPPDNEVKWSYTLFDKDQTAKAVGEKDQELALQGAYANIGAYYFSEGRIFIDEAEKMIKEGDMYGYPGKQEFYVAPVYQRLIKKGMKIKVAVIPKVWGLGTPKDLEYFLSCY